MSRAPLPLVAVACALFVGCIAKNAAVDLAQIELVEGKTTRRDMVAAWGNPDATSGNVWSWKDWRVLGGKVKLGYMGVGFTVSNTEMAHCEYQLTFDESGVLRSWELLAALPNGPQWNILPEDGK